jgi:single-strand DNA-binding protein
MSNFKELVRIGKDAVTRFTQGGKAVTGFSAAFDNGWGDKKQTVWLDCSLWGDRGEKLAPYLTKGSQIVVEGDIGTREHEGKTYLTLDVREVKLTGGKPDSKPASKPASRQSEFEPDDLDKVPF